MYIESDVPFIPALEDPNVTVTASMNGSVATTPLEYDAFKRDRTTGMVLLKCYDSRGAIIWLAIKQDILEEVVFGEI